MRLLILATLALALAIQLIWIRSFLRRDELRVTVGRSYWIISTHPHHVFAIATPTNAPMPTTARLGLAAYPARALYLEPRLGAGPQLGIPFWLPELVLLAPSLWWVLQFLRRRHRAARGLCVMCGYDLRAATDRCPECGATIRQPAAA